jgi:hypothetical protein
MMSPVLLPEKKSWSRSSSLRKRSSRMRYSMIRAALRIRVREKMRVLQCPAASPMMIRAQVTGENLAFWGCRSPSTASFMNQGISRAKPLVRRRKPAPAA